MIEIKNKKASFDYFIEEEIECGIVLKGTEIKSIRNGQANIKDCYAIVKNNEVFLLNMYIAKYNDEECASTLIWAFNIFSISSVKEDFSFNKSFISVSFNSNSKDQVW